MQVPAKCISNSSTGPSLSSEREDKFMKTLSPTLASHLAGRITTLATCWLAARRDGQRIGFTDHDRLLVVDGIACQPADGITASAMSGGPALAAGGGEIAGALAGPALTEEDLEAGLWDHAEIQTYLVNWQSPAEYHLLTRATIGEVTRTGAAFQAELRGLAHTLEARRGRVFSRICDADLGDARCTVQLAGSGFEATGLVQESAREWVLADGLNGFLDGWFSRGRLEVLSGSMAGFASEIANHRSHQGMAQLDLFQPAPKPIPVGSSVKVQAGCDKHFETCRLKFANQDNFQGFPHMPGSDFALSYPNSNSGKNDGSALV